MTKIWKSRYLCNCKNHNLYVLLGSALRDHEYRVRVRFGNEKSWERDLYRQKQYLIKGHTPQVAREHGWVRSAKAPEDMEPEDIGEGCVALEHRSGRYKLKEEESVE